MGHIVPILLLSLSTASMVLSSGLPHYITEKSFDDGLRECAQYFLVSDDTLEGYYKQGFPSSPEVKQLIRCTLINLNAWDDTTGVLEYVMANFFKPCPTDCDYAERTRACVKNALDKICPNDVFTRPYASFICYYSEYGNIVSDGQFVLNTQLELLQMMVFVESILNLPNEVIVQYSQGCILNEPHFPQVLFAWAVRGGYYTLDQGIQLDTLYTQYGIPELISPETRQCAADVAQTYCKADHVTIMYNTFINCLQAFLPFENLVQAFALQELECKQFVAVYK